MIQRFSQFTYQHLKIFVDSGYFNTKINMEFTFIITHFKYTIIKFEKTTTYYT